MNLPLRRAFLVLAAVVLSVAASLPASAAMLNDAANGQLIDSATWGGTAPGVGDTLEIDSHTVSTSIANGASVPDDLIINLSGDGTNGKIFFSYNTNLTTQSVTLNFNGGGTFDNSRGQMFYGGVNLNINGVNNTYHTGSGGEISHLGNTGATTSTVITGSGTLVKTGIGVLELRSIVNVLDADGVTPGNQTRTNASTFNGLWDVQAGTLEVLVPEFTKFATVNL